MSALRTALMHVLLTIGVPLYDRWPWPFKQFGGWCLGQVGTIAYSPDYAYEEQGMKRPTWHRVLGGPARPHPRALP